MIFIGFYKVYKFRTKLNNVVINIKIFCFVIHQCDLQKQATQLWSGLKEYRYWRSVDSW